MIVNFPPTRADDLMFKYKYFYACSSMCRAYYPDLLVGTLPVSEWIRYDFFGFCGAAFHPQASFADSGLRRFFKLASEGYEDDMYAENLVSIPFLARVGSDDRTA